LRRGRRPRSSLEVEDLALEAIQIGALAGDDVALLGEERGEVTVDLAVLEAKARQPSGILRYQAETSQRQDETEPGEVFLTVLAVPVGPAGWRGQDAGLLVPAHGGCRDTRSIRQLCDPHAQIVDLRLT
jgi:hypothetical protein